MFERMPSGPDFSQPDAAVPAEADFPRKKTDQPGLPNFEWLNLGVEPSNAPQEPALPEEQKDQGLSIDDEPLEATQPSFEQNV